MPFSNEVAAVAFSRNGERIATGSMDQRVRIWDLKKGRLIRVISGNGPRADSVAFSPAGPSVLVGGSDGKARLWDVDTGGKIQVFKNYEVLEYLYNMPTDSAPMLIRRKAPVSFSPDGQLVLTGFELSNPHLWDVKTGALVRELEGGGVGMLVFISDGKRALAAATGGPLKLLSTESSRIIRTLEGSLNTTSVAISPDGRLALAGGEDGKARLWNIDTGEPLRTLAGHDGAVTSVAFSADGRRAVSGGADRTARVWDIANGAHLRTLEGHGDGVSSVAFSSDSDGRFIATGSWDGATRLWDARAERGRELSLVGSGDHSWFVTDPEGRFDTGDADAIAGLNWTIPDDPFPALAPEIFMRDYYEPRLLSRLLDPEGRAQMPHIRPLAELNRVQPVVRIAGVEPGQQQDLARVTVEVTTAEETFRQGDSQITMQTSVYDLRLFRNGHLVGHWPELADGRTRRARPHLQGADGRLAGRRTGSHWGLTARRPAPSPSGSRIARNSGQWSSRRTPSTRTASRAAEPTYATMLLVTHLWESPGPTSSAWASGPPKAVAGIWPSLPPTHG